MGIDMGNTVDKLAELVKARQHQRILRLNFPNNDGPPCEFVAEKLEACEGMARDFLYTVEILSDRPNIALKDIHGKLISIELVQKHGTLRYFTGYCFSFRLVKAENIAHYEARLGPWLQYLHYRQDCYLFHNATLRDQADSILRDYGVLAAWAWQVRGDDPPMTDACQFNESDHNYLHRRWEAAGIYYHYEHDASGHKLILANESRHVAPIDGDCNVMFHEHAGAEEADAISAWSPVRTMAPGKVAVAQFDFKSDRPCNASVLTLNRQGQVPEIEHYEYTRAYGFRDYPAGDRMTRLRMEEMEAAAKQFEAAGTNTRIQAGRWFRLVDHFGKYPFEPHITTDDRVIANPAPCVIDEFLILTVRHVATNNYLEKESAPQYNNQFTCIRKSIPWRPGRGLCSTDTRIQAPQTALVVGPGGDGSIHTDEYGRIRVQFHWDREGTYTAASSAWIRVATNWAGSQFGVEAVPRVGTEVVVQWLDGCPDRPIVTGSVHNRLRPPSWTLPTQSALSGWRSRELGQGKSRSNHLVLDDTSERIQAQLSSDHAHSQLSLGHITRIEKNAGRTDARGEGWELATDAWGVARAARGMLLTTEGRPGAGGTIKDMDETLQRLWEAVDQHKSLTKLAQVAGAQEQHDTAEALTKQNDAIAGEDNSQFPELSEPHLILSSPAGIETTTAHSTHLSSGEHIALTSGKNISLSGAGLFASVSQTFRLFVHKAGMKLIAAAGKISINAQSDDIDIIADKVIKLISESDWVDIRGKKGVRIHGINNMLEIGEKTQFFTKSPVLFHGNLETLPSEIKVLNSAPTQATVPATISFDEQFQLVGADGKTPLANRHYQITSHDGRQWRGVSDAQGRTRRISTETATKLSIELISDFDSRISNPAEN
jgi:type VI secretion system secreted protein VgrG